VLQREGRSAGSAARNVQGPGRLGDRERTPLHPIVLDRTLKSPATTRSMALILQDTEGNKIGEIARSEELRR
jgi:hypothetical protein